MQTNVGRIANNRFNNNKARLIKEKFADERRIAPLVAKSESQKKALKALREKQVIVLSGSAGSGKSEIACYWASKLWLDGVVDNIVITRPYKHLGKDYGGVPGADWEKLLPFCMSMLMKFKKYLGVNVLKNAFNTDSSGSLFSVAKGISIVPIEKIQGLSFDDKTILIADEMQSATQDQMKALLTRLEEGCQLIITGDVIQSPLGPNNGLAMLEDILSSHHHPDISIIHFTPEDNCRSGVSGFMTKLFEERGVW